MRASVIIILLGTVIVSVVVYVAENDIMSNKRRTARDTKVERVRFLRQADLYYFIL